MLGMNKHAYIMCLFLLLPILFSLTCSTSPNNNINNNDNNVSDGNNINNNNNNVTIVELEERPAVGNQHNTGNTELFGMIDIYQGDDFVLGKATRHTLFRTANATYNLRLLAVEDDVEGSSGGSRTIGRKRKRSRRVGGDEEYEEVEVFDPTTVTTGMYVRVIGEVKRRKDVVKSGMVAEHDLVASELEVHIDTTTPHDKRGAQGGVDYRRAVFILINFGKDYPVDCTREYVNTHIVEGVDSWGGGLIGMMERASLSKVTFSDNLHADNSIDVFGPYTIDYDPTKCNPEDWANQAEAAARAAGVDMNRYQHRVYILPGIDALYRTCGWHGYGNVGCYPLVCTTWIANCDIVEVYMHELGHNLGFRHAASNWNQAGKIVEYGDPTSVMGNMWWSSEALDTRFFNGAEMAMNGYINPEKVAVISTSGTYQLAPVDFLPENIAEGVPQVIKIQHPDTNDWWYFSYRSNPTTLHAKKILVHQWIQYNLPTYIIRTLEVGEYFEDNVHRITVAILSYDNINVQYTLQISFGCVTSLTAYKLSTPVYDIDKQVIDIEQFDKHMSLNLRVINNDSPLCTATTYNFSSSIAPSGYSVKFDPDILYLVPGQNCTVAISLTPLTTSSVPTSSSPFSIRAIAKSGFSSKLHDIEISANFTVFETCIRGIPTLHVTPRVRVYFYDDFIYDVIMINNDNSKCGDSYASLNITLPAGWSYTTDLHTSSSPASPRHQLKFSITLMPPSVMTPSSTSIRNGSVIIDDDVIIGASFDGLAHEASVSFKLPANFTRCITAPPTIEAVDPNANTWFWGSMAASTLVKIRNNDNGLCENRTFDVIGNSDNANYMRVSLYPSNLALGPQQVGYARVIFGIPFFPDDEAFLNTTISVRGATEKVVMPIRLFRSPCYSNNLWINAKCPDSVNIKDGFILCSITIKNQDGWSCPYITLKLHTALIRSASLPHEDGWSISYNAPTQFTLFSQNATTINANITYPSTVGLGKYSFRFHGGEVANETALPHSFVVNVSTIISQCVPQKSIILMGSSSSVSIVLGQPASYVITVQNTDSPLCTMSSYNVKVNADDDMLTNFDVSIDRVVNLESQKSKNIWLTLTPKDTIKPLSENSTTRIFKFNVTISDPKNTTLHADTVLGDVVVDTSCILHPPDVVLRQAEDSNTPKPPGDAASATYYVNITNKDVGLCPDTTFSVRFVVAGDRSPPYQDVSLTYTSPASFELTMSPNQTVVQRGLTVYSRPNSPPEPYTVTIMVSDNKGIRHSASSRSSFLISCPVPRPVTNLTATQYTPFLKTMTAVSLVWNACDSPLWCCCPCQWEVYRNGEYIGTSHSTNYTDYDRPAGSDNSYSVITRDKTGMVSPTLTTCVSNVEIGVLPPDLTGLYIFIALVAGGFFWIFLLAVTIFLCVKKLKDKKEENVPLLHLRDSSDDVDSMDE